MGIIPLFVLPEKRGLCGSLFAFLKVAEPNADEPISLLRAQGHPFPQLYGDLRQLFARRRRGIRCVATGENLELSSLQFEDHGARYA